MTAKCSPASPESDTLDNIRRKLTCQICDKMFGTAGPRTPKILPCKHTFCKQCLMKLPVGRSKRLKCPECSETRHVSSVPKLESDLSVFAVLNAMNSQSASAVNNNSSTTAVESISDSDDTGTESAEEELKPRHFKIEFVARLFLVCVCLHFINSMLRDTIMRQQLLLCLKLSPLDCAATCKNVFSQPILVLLAGNKESLCVLVEWAASLVFGMYGRSTWRELKQVMRDMFELCFELVKIFGKILFVFLVCNILSNFIRTGHPLRSRDEL